MFNNISQTYTLADASSEIVIMFFWTFALWMLLSWLIKPSSSAVINKENQIIVPTAWNENNDLQLIEGIWPAIEKLLNKHDINSYVDIIAAGVSGLEEILEAWGSRFKIHVPTTWPDQARLANNQKWSELEEYQDILKAGK